MWAQEELQAHGPEGQVQVPETPENLRFVSVQLTRLVPKCDRNWG